MKKTQQERKAKVNIGDTVYFKTDSTPMNIISMSADNLEVEWFSDTGLERGEFPRVCFYVNWFSRKLLQSLARAFRESAPQDYDRALCIVSHSS